jgi:long-chain acyl-CoA synthetase
MGDVDLACCRKQYLPKYMVPRSVVIVDAVPLNANGKIAKPMLRKLSTR